MSSRETPRILLVDPDPSEMRTVANILQDEGCDVVSVDSRAQGCSILRSGDIDLVLCSWDPEENFRVMEEFHLHRKGEIPITLLTNNAARDKIAEVLNAGAADVLVRPLSPTELSARVWSQIGLRRAVLRLERREKELEDLTQLLQQEKSDRDKLLGIMAHDLKNPILGISGFLSELAGHYAEYSHEQVESFLRELRDSSLKVRDLLMNLLDWSKAQMSGEGLRISEVNLLHLVDQVAGILEGVFAAKGLRFHTKLEVFTVRSDADILAAVLRNLLTNAAKFTPKGGTVEVRSRAGRSGPVLEVHDTGVGMDLHTAAELMSFNKRLTTKGTAGETGTGLGLKLSRDLVVKAGGNLSLRSEKGNGTTVTIQLPQEASV